LIDGKEARGRVYGLWTVSPAFATDSVEGGERLMITKTAPDVDEKVEPRVPTKLLLSVKKIAELLSISERTVWMRSSCGEMPSPLSIGRLKRWPRDALEEWIAEHHKAAQRN
jgi:excisionase family DNA binding protein